MQPMIGLDGFHGTDAREALLLSLYRSASTEPAWDEFLQLCLATLTASYASLIFRRGPDRTVDAEFSAGTSVTHDMKLKYRDEFAPLDPIRYHDMVPARSYRLSELLQTGEVSSHPFYEGFLAPAGISYMLSARIVEQGGESAWLSLVRSQPQADFTKRDQSLFDSLLPHATVALHSFVLLDRHRVQAAIGRHVSTRFDMAAITLTAKGRVLGMGPIATSILSGTTVMTIGPDGHLYLRDRLLQNRLGDTITTVLASGNSRPLLVESDEERIEMLVTPFTSGRAYGVARPDIVLYLRRDKPAAAKDEIRQSLADLFGLTATEADIAIGLANGQTMAAVARNLGLAENTVRSYSKSIYSKLGVRRQVDLVRLLLLSVAHLA